MTTEQRAAAIRAAIRPYATVANFSIPDVLAAASAVVPDAAAEEVIEAFEALAAEADGAAAEARAEIERRAR